MRRKKYHMDVEALLSRGGEMTVADVRAACSDMPMPSVYAQIRKLVSEGRIRPVGKGRYATTPKTDYQTEVTPWMREASRFLTETLEGVNHCIRQREENLIVETDKVDIQRVCDALKARYGKVALLKDASRFGGPLDGYVLVGHLISEAPLDVKDDCPVSSLEKELVDRLCENTSVQGRANPLQRAMEVHSVNVNRLRRYASRRGVADELDGCLASLDRSRIEMFNKIQNYLTHTDIVKAWVFGSFARGEERVDSDLDLLVTYDFSHGVGLLQTIRYQLDMEQLIGREVDLVERTSLKPFAVPSAERDKYLIYER